MFTLDFVYPKRHPLCKTYVLVSKKQPQCKTDSTDSMFQNSCVSRLFDTDRCNFVRLLKHPTPELYIVHYPKRHPLCKTYVLVSKNQPQCKTDSTDSMFQNSCVSRLFDTGRCNFVREDGISE